MPTKFGNKRNPKTTQFYNLETIFTGIADPAVCAAIYNCLQSGAMISFGMNRAQTGIKVTVYEGKERDSEWANDPQEFVTVLADIAAAYLKTPPAQA